MREARVHSLFADLRERSPRLRGLLLRDFFVVTSIPVLLMAALAFGYLYNERLEAERNFGIDRAVARSAQIETSLERHSAELLHLIRQPEGLAIWRARTNDARDKALAAFAALVETYAQRRAREIVGFRLFDAEGRPLLKWGSWPEQIEETPNADYFLGALHLAAIRGGRAPVHVYHAGQDAPIIYSALLSDETGAIAGVAALAISVRPLFESLSREGPYRLVGVLDSRGLPVAEDLLGPAASLLSAETNMNWLAHESGVLTSRAIPGQLVAYARVRPWGQTAIKWTALYSIPLSEAIGPYRRAAFGAGAIALGALTVAALLAQSFASQIARPIARLALAADRLRRGDWNAPLPKRERDDEIHSLIESFRRMRQQIVETQLALNDKIDALKASEAALAVEKERLSVILAGIAEAVFTVGPDQTIRFANPAGEELLGLPLAEMEGRPAREVMRCAALQTGEPLDVPALLQEPVPGTTLAVRIARANGEERIVEVASRALTSPPAPEPLTILVMRDVTVAKRLEAERIRLERLQSLGVLAGGIAHDFNNLLGVIVGNLSLMEKIAPANGEFGRLVKESLNAAEHSRALTAQLLAFAKGGAPVKKRATLPNIAEESVEFATRGTSCRYRVEAADDIWPVLADPDQMHQVFHNLAINAVQAMPAGGDITVTLENCVLPQDDAPASLPPGRYVKIRFRDTGIGIAPEHLPRIFEPYFTTKQDGHGLGLSTAHGILRAHGGSIEVRPAQPGTEFIMYVPAAPVEAASSPPAEQPSVETEPAGRRILLLEDEEAVAVTVKRMLHHLGYDVTWTSRGEDCLRIFEEAAARGEPFDLLMLDLTVRGGMGGAEVLKIVRERNYTVPAIAGSGYSQLDVMIHPEQFGFNGVLTKPFTLSQLENAIQRACRAVQRA